MWRLERLSEITWESVHFVGADRFDAAAAEELISLHGGVLASVDSRQVADERTLLRSVGQALRFPDYYGVNRDALEECLKDLESWLPAKSYVLVVEHAERLWKTHPRPASVLLQIWLACAQEWSREGVPFHLVFVW